MLVGAALALSAGLVWIFTGEATVTIAYAAGLGALGAMAYALTRKRAVPEAVQGILADWSVTVAAIEQPGVGVAITDRASRLTCANSAFVDAFGISHPPPGLPLGEFAIEALTRAARAAWRDGSASLDALEGAENTWSVSVLRAGRGDDYLVWRFEPHTSSDPLAEMADRLAGPLGRVFSQAGVEAAVVGDDGIIRAASQGFALRATGDPAATLAGQDFASQLRGDERDRIYFAREGRKGSPQTLVQIPLAEAEPGRAVPHDAPSLMLLLDAGVGIGGAWGAEAQTGSPQLQALLEQLPLGLAMTDRDGHFLFANPAFMRACGLENKPLPPYPPDLVVKEDKAALSDAVRRYGQGSASSGDVAVRLKNNPDEPVSLGLAGVRGLGEPAVLLSLADTTE